MTASVAVLLLLMTQTTPATLDQVRTESNPQHRARDAVEFAAAAERQAEAAYDKGDTDGVRSDLKTMLLPSGDQSGCQSSADECVICTALPPPPTG